ncbi:hypothetical protein Efla_004626 [Eimeria flavescens]
MEPRSWQQLQERLASVAALPCFPVSSEIPMKGVILANRKTIFHKTRVCPRLAMGVCHLGNKCNFAHSLEELRPAPNLDRTKLCPSVLYPGTACPAALRGDSCRFAHSKAEIRHTSNMFKTNMCLKWIRGKCKKELQCNHAHGHQELKYYRSLAMASGSRDFFRESEATVCRKKKTAQVGNPQPALDGLNGLVYLAQQQQQQQQQARLQRGDAASCHQALLHLLGSGEPQQQQQQRGPVLFSAGSKLAALCQTLGVDPLEGDGGGGGPAGGRGPPSSFLPDDSTNATDECSDFSSLSSRTLSDAFRSVASVAAAPLESCMQTVDLNLTGPPLAAAGNAGLALSSSSSSEAASPSPLGVDRVLLLTMLKGEEAGFPGAAEAAQQEQELLLPAVTAAAANAAGSVPPEVEALDSSFARVTLEEGAPCRGPYYADPPPGFEGRTRVAQRRPWSQKDN